MDSGMDPPPPPSPRRRPPPVTPLDSVDRDPTDPPSPPSAAPDEASTKWSWASLLRSKPADLGLRLILVRDDAEELSHDGVKITFEHILSSPCTKGVMFIPDQNVLNDLRDQTFLPMPGVGPNSVPPPIWRKVIEFANGYYDKVIPRAATPPIAPSVPIVPRYVYAIIEARYRAVADSVKSAAAYAKSLAGSAIKNEQSVKVLQKRVADVEDKVAESLKAAKASLETAKEIKAIQQDIYNLMKKQVEDAASAKAGTIARLRGLVEKPKDIMAIVGQIAGYINILIEVNDIIEKIFKKLPPEAEEVPKVLEEMVTLIECIEVKESTYSVIGSFCRDLLSDLYASDVFSLEASDSESRIVSKIRRADEGRVDEASMETVLSNGLEVKLVTDMEKDGMISFSLDVHDGCKGSVAYSFPTNISEMRVRYQNLHGGCSAVLGNRPENHLSFSGIFGMKAFTVGADICVDGSKTCFSKYECSAGYDDAKYSASVSVSNKCDLLRATLAQKIWPGTMVGAEASYTLSSGEKSMWLGD